MESVAYGIAAADQGPDATVLMGLSAARLLGAIPRALAVAVVAVEKNRPNLALADRDAVVVFVRRDTTRLDAELLSTDLGGALVTTVEQTLLDLARRPRVGGVPDEAHAAVGALWPRADAATLDKLAGEQRLRAALRRARSWTAGQPVLSPAEAAAIAERFRVSDEQVRRDHLLTHLLAVLSRDLPDAVVFFGGTALARTHLPDGRLSEDRPARVARRHSAGPARTPTVV